MLRIGELCPWADSQSPSRYVHPALDEHGEPLIVCVEHSPTRLSLHYADGTRFHLDSGEGVIWATWMPPLTVEDMATYLLGPVLGLYLRLQGRVCLHASAVMLKGRCVAFVAPAGFGKSTLAAGLAATGSAVVTEDVACLDEGDEGFSVRSGYPLIRLWKESAELLPTGTLPPLTPNWDKRYLALDRRPGWFHERPAPLDAVFLLGKRRRMAAPAKIGRLKSQDTFTRLVANTYGNYLLDRAMRAHEFQVLGRLVGSVPVRSLTLNADGSRLLEACEWIRDHAIR